MEQTSQNTNFCNLSKKVKNLSYHSLEIDFNILKNNSYLKIKKSEKNILELLKQRFSNIIWYNSLWKCFKF